MSLFISCLLIIVKLALVLTEQTVTVNKCCPMGQVYNDSARGCVDAPPHVRNEEWRVSESFLLTNSNNETNIELAGERGKLTCADSDLKTVHLWSNGSLKFPDDDGAKYFFTESGVLLEEVLEVLGNTTYYHSLNHELNHYCADVAGDTVILRTCPKRCDQTEPCLRKCCPVGQHFDASGEYEECVESSDTMPHRGNLSILLDGEVKLINVDELTSRRYISGGEYDVLACVNTGVVSVSPDFSHVLVKKHFTFHISDGRPFYYDPGLKKWVEFKDVENYCFEHVVKHAEAEPNISDEGMVLFLCKYNASKANFGVQIGYSWEIAYKVTLVIAIFSLLLTTIVLLALIERQNIHTWARAAYIISQLICFSLIGFTYTSILSPTTYPGICKGFGVLLHFAALTTICWLSVINFDLWSTFRTLKPTGGQRGDGKRFALYSVFALGLPLLLISMALIIQSTKPDLSAKNSNTTNATNSWMIYPDYGEPMANGYRKCSLSEKAVPAYWFGPLIILMIANLIFLLTITMRMIQLRHMTRRLSTETSAGRYSFHIFAKIFIVSGITWNAEIIGWVVGGDNAHWVILFHYAQAVALFIIFVCKREVIRGLQKRYPILTKISPPLDSIRHSRPGTSAEATTKSRKLSTTSTSGITHAPMTKRESYEMRPTFLDSKCSHSEAVG